MMVTLISSKSELCIILGEKIASMLFGDSSGEDESQSDATESNKGSEIERIIA